MDKVKTHNSRKELKYQGGITPSPVAAPEFTPSLRIISHERKGHQRSDV